MKTTIEKNVQGLWVAKSLNTVTKYDLATYKNDKGKLVSVLRKFYNVTQSKKIVKRFDGFKAVIMRHDNTYVNENIIKAAHSNALNYVKKHYPIAF